MSEDNLTPNSVPNEPEEAQAVEAVQSNVEAAPEVAPQAAPEVAQATEVAPQAAPEAAPQAVPEPAPVVQPIEGHVATPSSSPLVDDPKNRSKPFGITAFVVGLVSILIAFIPVVNLFAIFTAIAGLVFGIISIVMASKVKAPKGFGITGTVCSAVAIIVTIVINVLFVVALGDYVASPEGKETLEGAIAGINEEVQKELNAISNVGVTIDGAKFTKNALDENVVIVDFTFTNTGTEATAFIYAVDTKVYQDGVELTTSVGAEGYDPSGVAKNIKGGKSIKVQMAYELSDNVNDVDVECKTMPYSALPSTILDSKTFPVTGLKLQSKV